jgi:hypothetical protein
MHRISVLLVLLVLVAACKKSESTQPASGSAASAAPTPTKPPPPIPCDTSIPASSVETYFKGATPKHDEPYIDDVTKAANTTCRFIFDEAKNSKVLIQTHCGPDFANLEDYLGALEKQIAAKFERVPGVGRGGYRIGTSTVGAQHRSLPCVVYVDLSYVDEANAARTRDYMPLIKEIEAAIPDHL